MTLEPGIRVVRGPDWKWAEQDGGIGHLGTIIPFENTNPNKPSVEVRWDRGLRGDYRIGYQDAYDLRLFDNGTVGVKHADIRCDVCQKSPIYGIRWKCRNIDNYNLCSSCYHGGKANIGHQFYRIVVPGAKGVLMEKRNACSPIEVKGLFPGAKVRVGSDLKVDKDDIRNSYKGTLKRLEPWEQGFPNTGASVQWPPLAGQSTYRVGHKGLMDLKTKDPSSGGFCYLTHLPVLGRPAEMEWVEGLTVGDHVVINMEEALLRELQEGHGEWVPGMADAIGKVGIIRAITSNQDLMVEYPKYSKKWIFHPAALTKVASRLASIVEVDESGDYKIAVDKTGQRSEVQEAIPKSKPSHSSASAGSPQSTDQRGQVRIHEVSTRIGLGKSKDLSEVVAIAAAQGNENNVRDILKTHPEWVNSPCDEKSPLQLAVHGGFLDVAKFLIAAGANVDMTDEDGDTALMFAVYSNHPGIVRYLLSKGANINVINNERRSALHQAVTRGYEDCIKVLLSYNCNVNMQDNFGDTALHDAISGQNKRVLSLLLDNGGIDFRLSNNRQFNALQWAAMKGNQYAVQRILTIEPDLASIQNMDGQTALHIAARNNFDDIVRMLIVKGECSVNEYTLDHQTPLLLAVRAGHVEVVEVLLKLWADVNMPDADGDTSLHVALLRQVIFQDVTETILIQKVKSQIPDQSVATSGLALACLLVEYKGDLYHVNNKGQRPLDIVPDAKIHAVLKYFVPEGGRSSPGHSDRESVQPEPSLPTNAFSTMLNQSGAERMRKQQEKIAYYEGQVGALLDPGGWDNRYAEAGPGAGGDGENQDASAVAGHEKEPDRKVDGGGVGVGASGRRQEHIQMQQDKEKQHRLAPSWSQPPTEDVAKVLDDDVLTQPHIAKQRMEEMRLAAEHQAALQDQHIAGHAGVSVACGNEASQGPIPEHIAKQEMAERKLVADHQAAFHVPDASAAEDNRDQVSEHITKQQLKERQLAADHQALHDGSASPHVENNNLIPGQNLDHIALQASKENQFDPNQPAPLQGPSPSPDAHHHHHHHPDIPPLDLSPQRMLQPHHPPSSETTPSPVSVMSTPTPTTLPPNLAQCQLGCGSVADAQFKPCNHITVCRRCAECFKLCHVCRKPIETVSSQSRTSPDFSNTDPQMGQQTPRAAPRAAASASQGASGGATDHPPGARRKILDSNSELTKSILIQKNQKLEEAVICQICMVERRELVFMCGHSLCEECRDSVDDCPFCRKPIVKAIKMY